MPTTIALATCREYPTLLTDDLPVVAGLSAAGVRAEAALWDGEADWGRYDAVLLRSVWDYYRHAAAFSAWLDRLDRLGVPCWNPTHLVRWNLDKRYLRDLEACGVATVPTLWLDRTLAPAPAEAVARILDTGWAEVVVKPTVSAGAWNTLRLGREQVAEQAEHLAALRVASGLMVQPFLPEVVSQGEHSLLFFDGVFSHAVLKRPRVGDFRVQWTHGGTQVATSPDAALIAQAGEVLAAAPSPGLYARVDGIVRDGRLVLMELEQIEPFLFLGESPGAAERFVRAVLGRL